MRRVGYILGTSVCGACIIPAPLEPEPLPPNEPPYVSLDGVRPSPNQGAVVTVTEDALTLRADQLFDPNDHEELSVFWYSATAEQLLQSTPSVRLDDADNPTGLGGTHYRFTPIELGLRPCARRDQVGDLETIVVYVSDGELGVANQQVVFPAPELFYTVSYTWTLRYNLECPT